MWVRGNIRQNKSMLFYKIAKVIKKNKVATTIKILTNNITISRNLTQ